MPDQCAKTAGRPLGLRPRPRSLTLSGQDWLFDFSVGLGGSANPRANPGCRIGARVALQRCPVLRPVTRSVIRKTGFNALIGLAFLEVFG